MTSILQTILLTSVVVIVFVFLTALIYYLVTRNTIKKRKEHFEQLHLNLKPGMYVEFANGLRGRVESVDDEVCDIRIKSGGLISVSRYAISGEIKK